MSAFTNCEIIFSLHSGKPLRAILQISRSNSLSLPHTHTRHTHTHRGNREGALAHCSVQSGVSAPWWLKMIGSQTPHTAETPRYMVTSRPPGIKATERRVFPPGGEDQQFFTLHKSPADDEQPSFKSVGKLESLSRFKTVSYQSQFD